MNPSSNIRRRTVLVAGFTGLVTLAGCFDDLAGSTGNGPSTYDLTIIRSGQDLEMRIEAGGDQRDIIQTHVGDTLTFNITNDTEEAVGFHNHANDEVFVIDSNGKHTTEFEAGAEMTGRHEIEGWIVEGTSAGDTTVTPGEHGQSATTLAVIEVRPGGR